MGLSRLFGVCAALLLAASSVNAAVTIDLGPSDWRRWGDGTAHHHTNGLNTKFGQTVRMPPLNTNLTVTRNPVIPYGSISNGLRQFVRVNPASIAASGAVTALFLAVDWVFDEAAGEWRTVGDEVIEDPELGLWSAFGASFPTPEAACEYAVPLAHSSFTYYRYEISGNTGLCYGIAANGNISPLTNITRTSDCPQGSVYDSSTGLCVIEEGFLPLTSSDWADLTSYLPTAPAEVVGSAAGDAMQRQGAPLNGYSDMQIEGPSSVTGPETTTTTTTETGDSIVTSTQTTTNISYGDTTITTADTTTKTTYTNGVQTSTETTVETPGELPVTEPSSGGAAGEWPGFCEWASIVCDWIGWTQEEPPAEPDLPQVIDDDFYEEKTIQFGAKSCPPDYEINIPFLNTVVAVSMQPLCDFAGIIYYMVMAASYIIAAYITIGVARNG